ncbi:MAG: hypothetical protein ACUZ8H_00195 [Candidatus Anammoxibacter sp.]
MKIFEMKKLSDHPVDRLEWANGMIMYVSNTLCHNESEIIELADGAREGLYCIFTVIYDAIKDIQNDLEKIDNLEDLIAEGKRNENRHTKPD